MIGKTIGPYLIVEKIGHGGMGVVYRAEDQRLRRNVALKILPDDFAGDSQHLARFQVEAQVLASLSHPNIAAIYGLEDAPQGHALVMELIEGPTVLDRIAEGPIPQEEMLALALQIGEGLAAAHGKGIIHRDLKPANVKITAEGRVKVLDFGLAKSVGAPEAHPFDEDSPTDSLGGELSVAGTLAYMAPEQLRGETIDARCDIYSFGVLLYEMAVGQRPFGDSNGAKLIGDIQHTAPIPPRQINPEISNRVESIILKCQEKDPELRYRSMAEVLEALRLAAATAGEPDKSLAVLYFENLSGEKEDEYFRDGITEDIIVELSRIGDLAVFPRFAVLTYRDRSVSAPQVGRELGATHILDGSVRRSGDRLRITTELVEVRPQRAIWAERYDRRIDDIFTIQDEIARNITRALRVVLSKDEERAIAKVPTTNVKAYEYYLRGRQHFRIFRRRSIEFAADMFHRSIEIDPEYAAAHAGLAECHSYLYMFWAATEENMRAADEASGRAVALDPELAEAHVARGVAISLRKQHEEAAKEFETAIRLNPQLFEAYYFYARGHYARGNLEEAVYWFERASRARPADYQALTLQSSALTGLGRTEEAAAVCRSALERARKLLDVNPGDTRALYFSAVALCHLEESEEQALELAQRALEIDPEEPQVLYNVGCVYALLGRNDRAIECLAKTIEHGEWWKTWMKNDPDLVSLHGDPRFQSLIG